MEEDRITAIQILIGAVRGYTDLEPNLTEIEKHMVTRNGLRALVALGVTNEELREAIMTAPYLDFSQATEGNEGTMSDDRPTGVYPSQFGPTDDGKPRWDAVYRFHGGGSSRATFLSREEAEESVRSSQIRNENFWRVRAREMDENTVIIDHYYYGIGKEPANRYEGGPYGFGGREFHIEWLSDGKRVVTHNLWSGGAIPPEYWDILPDNARFVNGEHWEESYGVKYMVNPKPQEGNE